VEPRGVLKQIPIQDTIDENVTIDYSRKGSAVIGDRVPVAAPSPSSSLLSALSIKIQPPRREARPPPPKEIGLEGSLDRSVSSVHYRPPPPLSTALINAIQHRRKCVDKNTQILKALSQEEGAAKCAVSEDRQEDTVAKPRTLRTPLKRAIQSRLERVQKENEALDKVERQVLSTISEHHVVEKPVLFTPLKKAIHDRRAVTPAEAPADSPAASPQDQDLDLVKRSLSLHTPLRRAIESRRKTLQHVAETLDTVLHEVVPEEKTPLSPVPPLSTSHQPKSLRTPLRSAIESRRRSVQEEEQALVRYREIGGDDGQSLGGGDLNVKTARMKTPLRQQIESKGLRVAGAVRERKKALGTPLRRAIETRKTTLSAETSALQVLNREGAVGRVIDSRLRSLGKEQTALAVVNPDTLIDSQKETQLRPALHTPLRRAIRDRRRRLSEEVKQLEILETLTMQVPSDQLLSNDLHAADTAALSSRRVMKTPLRVATQQRRGNASTDTRPNDEALKYPTLRTPLRVAIQRAGELKRDGNEPRADDSVCPAPSRTLHTPLRHAIQERRRSLQQEERELQAVESYGLEESHHEDEDEVWTGEESAMMTCARLSIASYASSLDLHEREEDQVRALYLPYAS
jgi:hypothetical protein